MNGNQLELYVEYTENQPQENTAEPESDSAADIDTEETQNTAVQQNVHISVSKFVIGGILGAVLACIFCVVKISVFRQSSIRGRDQDSLS